MIIICASEFTQIKDNNVIIVYYTSKLFPFIFLNEVNHP